MVSKIKYYLVGGYLREDSKRHDVDIVGVMGKSLFKQMFDYTHETLMKAYKETPYPEKLEKYIICNRVTGHGFSEIFGKQVDFKWILPSMLYNPHIELHLEADVTMYL